MKQWHKTLVGLGLLAALVGTTLLLSQREAPQVQARLVSLADEGSDIQSEGFLRATGPKDLVFPADHGPHLDYQTEWWYYTGNLVAPGGQRFGYQLTFFRRALVPPPLRSERESQWAADQVYMAHFALTDVEDRSYHAFERFSRGAAGLAGAQATPYRVWLDDWQVEEVEPGVTRLRAQIGPADAAESQGTLSLDLLLKDRKGPILQGDRGFSPKGPQPGNASYYYSLTRMETRGTVHIGEVRYQVSGLSWMDHEWSTSGLAADQIGWDWFSIQLDDGSELMVFQLRKEDGSIDLYSSGTFVAPDGNTRHLGHEDFEIRVEDSWRSPNSGATYPAGWTLVVPKLDLTLSIDPYLSDQELIVSYAYWEGAVEVEGERAGQAVSGSGYVELTGYAGSMQGQL